MRTRTKVTTLFAAAVVVGAGAATAATAGSNHDANIVHLVVTALQPGTEGDDGSFTLAWNPDDFALTDPSNPGNAPNTGCATDPNAPDDHVWCTYDTLGHSAKSVSFNFTAQNANP